MKAKKDVNEFQQEKYRAFKRYSNICNVIFDERSCTEQQLADRLQIPLSKIKKGLNELKEYGFVEKTKGGYTLTLDALSERALQKAPKIEGYTVEQLDDITETPWPTKNWHLELLEPRETVESFNIKRTKIHALGKKAAGKVKVPC